MNKKEALARIVAIQKETEELKKIINTPDTPVLPSLVDIAETVMKNPYTNKIYSTNNIGDIKKNDSIKASFSIAGAERYLGAFTSTYQAAEGLKQLITLKNICDYYWYTTKHNNASTTDQYTIVIHPETGELSVWAANTFRGTIKFKEKKRALNSIKIMGKDNVVKALMWASFEPKYNTGK